MYQPPPRNNYTPQNYQPKRYYGKQPYSAPGTFTPKKPVKSFQDLEVYQKSLEAAVFVSTQLCHPVAEVRAFPGDASANVAISAGNQLPKGNRNIGSGTAQELIFKNMLPCALGIPHLIAESHSLRFGAQDDCILMLEKVMVNCNKMVVYLEQVRDICDTGVSKESFDELMKKYFYVRRKVLNLQRSWKKFMGEKLLPGERPAS